MKLLLIPFFLILSSCGDDTSSTPVETVKTLRKVKSGSGGECVNLEFTHLKCVEGDKSLLSDDTVAEIKEAEPLKLSLDADGRQVYELKNDMSDPITIASITKALFTEKGNVLAVALLKYVESKIYSFMVWMSDGGIKADGTVQDYSMSLFGQTLPIKYSVDCKNNKTSFHMAISDYGLRYIIQPMEDGVYKIETRQTSDNGKKVEFNKGYCIPMVIEPNPNQEDQTQNNLNSAEKDSGRGILSWIFSN